MEIKLPEGSIDSIIENISKECATEAQNVACEFVTLTLWVPRETKDKFTKLQEKTNRKLGKELRKVISRTVETVDIALSEKEPA